MPTEAHRAVEAVWRIEAPRLIAGLMRLVGDVGLAEELAQDAMVAALEQWPAEGGPCNPGAWLMTTAERRAIDRIRRDRGARRADPATPGRPDDSRDRARLPGAGKDCGATDRAGEEVPREGAGAVRGAPGRGPHGAARVGARGDLPDLQRGVCRHSRRGLDAAGVVRERFAVGRVLSRLAPREPEVHGLVALMELQASRAGARTGPDGIPILLAEQNRSRWDRLLIRRGLAALEQAESLVLQPQLW